MATDGKATWWNSTSGAPAWNAQELRQIDSLEVMPGPAAEPFSGRPGRRVNGKGLEVSVSSTGNGTVTVAAGVCLLYSSAQASQGVWQVQFPQVGPIALGVRPAAGLSRIVLVLVRLYDSDIGVGSVKEAKIELLAGSDNASPTPPSIPAGAIALVLDTLTVPSSGAITHVQTTQRTVAAGGILPVATVAERDQLKTDGIAYEGMYVDVAATDSLDRYDGTNWVQVNGDTGWVTPTLGGSPAWTSYDGGTNYNVPQYKRSAGEVQLRGVMKGGAGSPFTLPAGFRPLKQQQFTTTSGAGGTARTDVQADGQVMIIGYSASGSAASVALNGIRFVVEQ